MPEDGARQVARAGAVAVRAGGRGGGRQPGRCACSSVAGHRAGPFCRATLRRDGRLAAAVVVGDVHVGAGQQKPRRREAGQALADLGAGPVHAAGDQRPGQEALGAPRHRLERRDASRRAAALVAHQLARAAQAHTGACRPRGGATDAGARSRRALRGGAHRWRTVTAPVRTAAPISVRHRYASSGQRCRR